MINNVHNMQYRKILLIDDDEDDQEIFISALENTAKQVSCLTFKDAREALSKLASKEISPELIFLDLNMPMMDGQQFLTEIKKDEALSDIHIIILSTSSHRGTIQLMKELGAQDFITKPDKFEDLVRILDSVLN